MGFRLGGLRFGVQSSVFKVFRILFLLKLVSFRCKCCNYEDFREGSDRSLLQTYHPLKSRAARSLSATDCHKPSSTYIETHTHTHLA